MQVLHLYIVEVASIIAKMMTIARVLEVKKNLIYMKF